MIGDTAPPAPHLLGRAEIAGNLSAAAGWLADKRVLVTGAAGSVGTPLAHLLAGIGPKQLVLLDHHEHSLFSLERSLGGAGLLSAKVTFELMDVRQEQGMRRVFGNYQPEVVMHLAAAKHVPYGERFPAGVVESNVLATESLLALSAASDVSTFVYPSSDKSVLPPSLYGATKRLCEAMVQRLARSADGRRWVCVRYVNIIGTRGSVIETFAAQVREGASLSVTDARMTRYWISMREAMWLLLEAARAAPSGSLAMVDCGEPVPILETARRLAQWYAPERVPYPTRVTGIRPGERLDEILLSPNESFEPGPAEGLRAVHTKRDLSVIDGVAEVVSRLRAMVEGGDDGARVRGAAMQAANELQ